LVLQQPHSGTVLVAVFSANGHALATGSADGTVKIWDVRTGDLRATLSDLGEVSHLAFSPDNRLLIVGGPHIFAIWDLKAGKSLHNEYFSQWIDDVALSPDGLTAAVALRRSITLYDTRTGTRVRSFPDPDTWFNTLTFSADGRRLVSSTYDRATIWDLETNERIASYRTRREPRHSPDGRSLLTTTRNGNFIVFDVDSGRRRTEVTTGTPRDMEFSPDGQTFATLDSEGKVSLWRTDTGDLVADFRATERPTDYGSIRFNPHGDTLFTHLNSEIIWWEPSSGRHGRAVISRPMKQAIFSPDGSMLAVLDGSNWVTLWAAIPSSDLAPLRTIGGLSNLGRTTAVAVHPDGQTILTTSLNYPDLYSAKIWSAESGQLLSAFDVVTEGPEIAIDHSGKFLLGVHDGSGVFLYDVNSQGVGHIIAPNPVSAFVLSPDATLLAFTHAFDWLAPRKTILTLEVWNVDPPGLQTELAKSGRRRMEPLAISPDNRHVAVAAASGVEIWDTESGHLLIRLSHSQVAKSHWPYEEAIFSPDGERIASWSAQSVGIWSVQTGNLITEIFAHSTIENVAFSPDGQFLAIGETTGWAEIWDVAANQQRAAARGFGPLHVAFRPLSQSAVPFELVTSGDILSLHRFDEDWNASSIDLSAFLTDQTERRKGMTLAHRSVHLVSTRNGLFTGDEEAFDKLLYRLGPDLLESDLVTPDQLFDYFYRPSLMSDFHNGYPTDLHLDVAEGLGSPPHVEFVDLPTEPVETDEIQIHVRASSRGGGVTGIQLFNNGARVDENSVTARGITRISDDSNEDVFEQTFTVTLSPGETNVLRAHALSSRGLVRSPPTTAKVEHAGFRTPPDLYLFVVSLEKYVDPKISLWLPHEDAKAIVDAFERQEGRIFANVHTITLADGTATLEGVGGKLAEIAARARPQDVFIMFYAGHGEVATCGETEDSSEYHLFTYRTTFSSDSVICREGLSAERLMDSLAKISSSKKLLIIDACRSGSAATGANLIAMRGAQEREAITRLARSQGLAIIAASTEAQFAYEKSSVGHGLFTYVLLEGLGGKAAAEGESIVTVSLLGAYVGRELPREATKIERTQEATLSMQGQDFPLFSFRAGETLVNAASPSNPQARAPTERIDAQIDAHVSRSRTLVLDCLGRDEAVVVADVQSDGSVTFSAANVDPQSPEARCLRKAIPALRVDTRSGKTRIPLRR
jgi:WD40 repeat protein